MSQGEEEESVWGGNESCPSEGRRPNKIINTRGTWKKKKKKKGLGRDGGHWACFLVRCVLPPLLYERPSARSAFFPSPESETPKVMTHKSPPFPFRYYAD